MPASCCGGCPTATRAPGIRGRRSPGGNGTCRSTRALAPWLWASGKRRIAASGSVCRVRGRRLREETMRATSFLLLCAALVAVTTRPAFAGQEGPSAATVEAAPAADSSSDAPPSDSLTRAALLAAARDQKGL